MRIVAMGEKDGKKIGEAINERGKHSQLRTLGISAGDALPTLFTGPLVRAVRKQLKLDTPSEGEGVGLQADLENA